MTVLKRPELNSPKLDVVVLGARAEEKNALVRELHKVSDSSEAVNLQTRLKQSKSSLPVFAVQDAVEKGRTISVGVMDCADMGNVAAAINTAYVLGRYQPTLVIFSGIGGSLDATKFRIGDVILPRTVRTRYFQKLKKFSGNYSTAPVHVKTEVLECVSGHLHAFDKTANISRRGRELVSHVNNERLNMLLSNAEIPGEWVASQGIPSRKARVIDEEFSFSWEKVLSNKEYIAFLKPLIGNACTVVDMESFGFLSAVSRLTGEDVTGSALPCHSVVVRAVSDFAEHKELSDSDPRWRELGLENMAIATRYLIQEVYSKVF